MVRSIVGNVVAVSCVSAVWKFRAPLTCWRPESRKAAWSVDPVESLVEVGGERTSSRVSRRAPLQSLRNGSRQATGGVDSTLAPLLLISVHSDGRTTFSRGLACLPPPAQVSGGEVRSF